MTSDPFSPIAVNAEAGERSSGRKDLVSVMPVPDYATEPPQHHPNLGVPTATWAYKNMSGELLGYILRFDMQDGRKEFRPLTLWAANGRLIWKWQGWSQPRPLYGQEHLAANPEAPVVICEGEKAADAARVLLPDMIAITNPGGSNGAACADWSCLAGRQVVIWPDNDEAGQSHAAEVGKQLAKVGVGKVKLIELPAGLRKGWDAADARNEGWTQNQVRDLVERAKPFECKPKLPENLDAPDKERPGRLGRDLDRLLGDCAKDAEYWHDGDRKAYASIPKDGHWEHYPVDSEVFRDWLSARFYDRHERALPMQALNEHGRVLRMKALSNGGLRNVMRRIGRSEGACWLDLGDGDWRAIRINETGWTIDRNPSAKFVRSASTRDIPEPRKGGSLDELRKFLNVDDQSFMLIVGWLINALYGSATSFPILVLNGEQGSGKSTAARLLRSLVDPSAVPVHALPRDERDLAVMAANNHVLGFDNVSKIDPLLSDALCRLSSGAGFMTRKLHSDSDVSYFVGARPIMINGIPSLASQADLADRCLGVELKRIDPRERKTDAEYWTSWEAVRPGILGVLLDAVSAAMANLDATVLDSLPRMADFAKLVTAAENHLGWESGAFIAAYDENRSAMSENIIEVDPVASAIVKLIKKTESGLWTGTATELLADLEVHIDERMTRTPLWPKSAGALGNALKRATPVLRQQGVHVVRKSTGTERLIMIHMNPG